MIYLLLLTISTNSNGLNTSMSETKCSNRSQLVNMVTVLTHFYLLNFWMKMGTDLFINNHEKWHFRKFLPLFLWRNKKLWQHVKWLIKGSDLHSFYIFPLHTLIKNITFHFDKSECTHTLRTKMQLYTLKKQ